MFSWFRGLIFGKTFVPHDPPLEEYQKHVKANEERKAAEEAKAKKAVKPKTKKPATKKAKEKVDLGSMNKTQLLAEAKKRGIKANASLKKDEILERINNG